MTANLEVFDTPRQLALAGAERFAVLAAESVRQRGRFIVALSGGTTPGPLYERLADPNGPGRSVPWQDVHVCWGDERHVPPDHPDSNYREAREALLRHVPVPAAQIHRIHGEYPDADRAARVYEQELRGLFGLGSDGVPSFDLLLLGVGSDGHTASLFPGSPALRESRRLVVAPWVEGPGACRISLSPPVLSNALETIVLVSGAAKAATLAAVLEGPVDPVRLPAQLLRDARGHVRWLLDRDAASALSRG